MVVIIGVDVHLWPIEVYVKNKCFVKGMNRLDWCRRCQLQALNTDYSNCLNLYKIQSLAGIEGMW